MTRWCGGWLVIGILVAGSAWWQETGEALGAELSAPTAPTAPSAAASDPNSGPIVHIVRPGEKLEMVVNTSRILTLRNKIPHAMVNNPDIVAVTPLSPTQFQISAKKPGVTQVNLFDEKQQIYTIDVVVTGDARELTSLLAAEFPTAAIRVRPVSNGVLISGYVDRPEDADRIKQLAEEYYPKVINNLTVAGVQQVLLHIKVYEVSRTKLRNLGFDFAQLSNGAFVASSISQIITGVGAGGVTAGGSSTFAFQAVDGGSSFFGVLDALRQHDLAKVLSEPTLVTQSGRPAYFRVGGEIPYAVSQGLGAVSVEWKNYGTRLDFVPFVLGNGRIRLEVRPQVSEVDNTRSTVQGVPAIKVRESDTGVELEAGQTLAIAGLVQTRVEAQNRGLPWVSDVPYIGALFRRTREENNEIETLILVTPEIVDALDPDEVPPCPPGTNTASPNDWQLHMRGKLEVPHGGPRGNGGRGVWSAAEEGQDPSTSAPAEPSGGTHPTPEPVPTPSPAVPKGPAFPTESKSNLFYKTRTPTVARSDSPSARQESTPSATRGGRQAGASGPGGLPGFLGPVGYDGGE